MKAIPMHDEESWSVRRQITLPEGEKLEFWNFKKEQWCSIWVPDDEILTDKETANNFVIQNSCTCEDIQYDFDICPYSEDVNDKKINCSCCIYCRKQCARDI